MWYKVNHTSCCLSVCCGALALVGLETCVRPAFAASDPAPTSDTQAIEKELRVMAKVLEESLNQSDLEDWHAVSIGSSAFEPKIKSQYIPTVGAIFTIPVKFPVTEPETAEEEADTTEDRAEDLWDKYASEPAPFGDSGHTNVMRDGGVHVLPYISELIKTIRDDDENKQEEVEELDEILAELPGIARMCEQMGVSSPEVDLRAWRSTDAQAYDADKVGELRKTLLQALAHYARRMEHIPESERILIVVEAPRPLGTLKMRQQGENLPFVVRKQVGPGPGEHLTTIIRKSALPGPRDHYLIAVNKADLQEAITQEELANKLQEIRY